VDQVEDPHQDHASNSCDQNLGDPTGGLDADKAGKESSNHAADQAYDKVTEQSVAGAANEHSGQPASDNSANYPN
jgi:hypothetical protein